MTDVFASVRTVGGLLPPDLLGRVVAGDRALGGMTSSDYHLGGRESTREAANRHWQYLLGVYRDFRADLVEAEGAGKSIGPAVGLTRERWLMLLLNALGYGRPTPVPAGGLEADGRAFPLSHLSGHVPLHLLGWGVDLDARTPAVPGAAKQRPHAMLQELLNRSDDHLWAVLTNGRQLRLLRDSTSLSGQSFVELDLEAMFDGEVFSDFVLLFLLAHASRLEVRTPEGAPADCWLEAWRTTAAESGTRALALLRDGVQEAIGTLATGFLRHPSGADLNRRLAAGEVRLSDYHAEVLRLVYRLLFVFVVEDRGLLHGTGTEAYLRDRYARYFSTRRLRELAVRRRGDSHPDLWRSLTLVVDGLGTDGGRPELGLHYLGGLYDTVEDGGGAELLTGLDIANRDLLTAVRQLCVVQPRGQARRRVDYRNLDAEELGSIYESLLELVPRHDADSRTVTLELLAGNDRKTSGSYYTPSALIDLVLDEALDPLLDRAWRQPDRQEALLALTVCDPACGSGHFLVAAARRIAVRLARARTGDLDPTPTDVQEALHDVVGQCVYGVDVTPLALDLARVSLWLASVRPDRPLAFLDAHLKVGNALLGATPALVLRGVPDAAFAALEGDDKRHVTALRKRNKREREENASAHDQLDLLAEGGVEVSNHAAREAVAAVHAEKLLTREDVRVARQRLRQAERSPEAVATRLAADTWCAAFVQPKELGRVAITDDAVQAAAARTLDEDVERDVVSLRDRYRFFHWHLEFPEVFDVPVGGAGTSTGWRGGFSAMVGNPPWERVKLQEQEYFASRHPGIADAANAAKRKKAIAALETSDSEAERGLFVDFRAARRRSEGVSHLLRASGRYPLCGVGDVNTYSVFAEHMRSVIAPEGRTGVITPTGLATDNTTSAFFADTLRAGRLAAFYDFENEAKIFAGVHNQLRFAVTAMTGGEPVERVALAFYTRFIRDVPARRFALTADEVLAVNPNTGTLPIFRTRADAEITLAAYGRHPVLIRDSGPGLNAWGLRFARLMDMANDSDFFESASDLHSLGEAAYDGWDWRHGARGLLPLYEAKMLGHYDHRYATYDGATQAQLNKGTLPRLTTDQHDDPEQEPLARYWVDESHVDDAIGDRWDRDWLFGWRDIARASDARTMVPSVLPRSAVGNKFPLAFPEKPEDAALLQAVWSSLAFDYIARQKLSGTGMTYFILKQLACPAPATFDEVPDWAGVLLRDWVVPRVVELTYTSHRIASYAADLGDEGEPFRWDPERRALIRAELDAAMLHVYGLTRAEAEHVIDSFSVMRKYEERDHGEYRTRRLVLSAYDDMAAATPGAPAPTLDPPPGQGRRHAPRHPADVHPQET